MKKITVTGALAADAQRADLRRLLARARRRLARNRRTIGPDYLYVAYWAAIRGGGDRAIEDLHAALRRAHA